MCGRPTITTLIFVGDIISRVGFWPFWFQVTWPWSQPLHEFFDHKFLLETRLQSESFEPLVAILAFLVQKLWSKNNKKSISINQGINQLCCFQVIILCFRPIFTTDFKLYIGIKMYT